jgi:hypothetical protein
MDEMSSDKEKIVRTLKFVAKLKVILSGRSLLEVSQDLRRRVEEMNQGYLVRRSKNQLVIKFTLLINCD